MLSAMSEITYEFDTVIGVDIGGTTIEAAAVSPTGTFLHDPVAAESPSNGTYEEVVSHLADVVLAACERTPNGIVGASSFGMPGPFKYAEGVSDMDHKFAAIKGLPLGQLITERTGLPTYWMNDADAFGVGAAGWFANLKPGARRVIGITIGTGLGGSFVEDGEVVASDDHRTPMDGEIWNLPRGGNILEHWVSGPGLARIYESMTGESLDAKTVSVMARSGDKAAIAAYEQMGVILGEALAPLSARFEADAIVVGGNVAKSFKLFASAMVGEMVRRNQEPHVIPAPTDNLAIRGAARYAFTNL